MKYFLIGLIKVYQLIPGPWHNSCRHIPTCSQYGIEAISEYGSIKGVFLTVKRLLKCTPWGTSGYDPVKTEGTKK